MLSLNAAGALFGIGGNLEIGFAINLTNRHAVAFARGGGSGGLGIVGGVEGSMTLGSLDEAVGAGDAFESELGLPKNPEIGGRKVGANFVSDCESAVSSGFCGFGVNLNVFGLGFFPVNRTGSSTRTRAFPFGPAGRGVFGGSCDANMMMASCLTGGG